MCEFQVTMAPESEAASDDATKSPRCVGVVIGIPDPLASELEDWRASFGDPMAALVPAHITLITTTTTTNWTAMLDHVRQVAAEQRPFTVTLSGSGTFRPVSPVVFVNLSSGFDECVSLHRKLQCGPLVRDLPFPYHPHVTVAHDVSSASMDSALTRLADYEASFRVDSMGLYEHDKSGVWKLREDLNFGADEEEAGGDRG